ncbi:ABC transporter ATP-binding protein [Cellulomonas sp. P24]|uniref:ABC transporter ATP-binding protein n=1 Tax=Cellulomonas sp. P24 TaxID=2885206 RepID=UPI00216B1C7C|nr:ABC transporter ATP-binding protein [Cellulomonas sp. P24]MCR6491771.1 ABC transporter ATP-binding protein [Cellulomonas sp. P24]
MSTPVVEVADLSKRFVIRKDKSLKERIVNARRSALHKDEFWALRDVNITIDAGSTIGLIGPNGSGKSTLLKMIGGILQPTSGSVRLRGRVAALLELGAGFHPDLTGRENVYLNASLQGLTRKQTDSFFDAIVDFSGIERFIDTQVKFYSSGMYVRLAFAVAVHVDPDILLVDEVLAVGDEPFQRKCMDRIRGFQDEGRTIVLVTHALDTVAEICDRAVVLESGRVIADGSPRDALRVLRSEFEHSRHEEIERQQAAEVSSLPEVPRAQIEGIEVLSDGTAVRELAVGSPMSVRVHVRADQTLDDWILGFGIENSAGQTIYGTNSKLLNTPLPTLRGSATYDFAIPAINVGEGSYTFHGAVATRTGAEVHRLLEGATLTLTGDGQETGFVHLRTSLTPSDR